MQHGFKSIVRDLVRAHPGLSSDEYAIMALEKGLARSDSKDPVFALQSTLRKEVREGRMPDIIARKVDRKLHYFPANQSPSLLAGTPPLPVANTEPQKTAQLTVLVPSDIV